MLKKCFLLIFFFVSVATFGQISEVPNQLKKIRFSMLDSLTGWKKHGNIKLNLNQSSHSHWQSNHNSSIEVNSHLRYNFTYQKNNIIWDNLLLTDYGLSKMQGYDIRKTTDKIEINSIVGGQLPKNWSYSFFLNLQTQLTNSYNYDEDNSKENRIAGFLAPLYTTAGPGIMWRKSENLHFNVAPITTKIVYINGRVSKYDSDLARFVSSDNTTLYGIEPGEDIQFKFGFYAAAFYKFNLMKNVVVDNRFSLYSNYLEDVKNFDLDYTMNVEMKVNKFIKSNVQVQLRYDNNEHPGFQARETLGLGVKFKL